MPRTTSARHDAIATAADLFRRQGYAATGLEQILAVSGAPKGSFYHYFPDGKEQLAVQSLTFSGERVLQRIEHAAAITPSAGALVTAIAAGQARDLRDSGFALGCPVATLALELAGTSEPIAQVANAAFASWAAPLADRLIAEGRSAVEAARLARWAVANLEGALVLARAARDATIVTDAAAITAAVLDGRTDLEG
ncbi:TetR/AcrR family transcriptional regulator [Agromyces bauzanensis]|uniref:TetR family transcriptional regulator n=1 Tax=Agromyces bauzanensis TaxID=1308924 RepID=A0A917PUI6_9MICO|nr:TetR/AcrR family transcriptional regulator [Agromyces bauzanensis]GGJ92503.1 TetR family transcriptional regulator [Agromyces bauzanensis]